MAINKNNPDDTLIERALLYIPFFNRANMKYPMPINSDKMIVETSLDTDSPLRLFSNPLFTDIAVIISEIVNTIYLSYVETNSAPFDMIDVSICLFASII